MSTWFLLVAALSLFSCSTQRTSVAYAFVPVGTTSQTTHGSPLPGRERCGGRAAPSNDDRATDGPASSDLRPAESPSAPNDRRRFLSSAAAASLGIVALVAAAGGAVAAGESDANPTGTDAIPEPESAPAPPTKRKGGPDPRFFLAGGASAAFSHGYTTPIDVVKTRMQADPETYGGGVGRAALTILEAEGAGALLTGLGPTVIGYGVEGALKFGVYESLKPVMLAAFDAVDPAQPYLAAAVCAGALASVILCPMEETRIRLVTDPSFGKGLIDGLPRIIREEGLLSTFGGFGAMLSKQVPYTMGKQVSFDMFTAILYAGLAGYAWLPEAELNFEVEVGAAFLASVVACIASQPGDVLLTATYRREKDQRGLVQTVGSVYDNGGGNAFFRGISARFIHVGAIITTQLVIYDQLKQLLGLPGSGTGGT